MAPTFTVEVHVPASPTPHFANMLFFLVHSLADRAGFPGPWKIVVTLGRDGALTPDCPEFAWAQNFPVEFRHADAALWNRFAAEADRLRVPTYVHNATIVTQLGQMHDADIVIYMDADTVVVSPFRDLMELVLATDVMAAKPAWQPPPVDLDAIIAHAGLRYDGPPVQYSGYGWSFIEPRFAPPYLNGGFIVCSRHSAELQRMSLLEYFEFVSTTYPGHFVWQIASCLTIIRQGVRWHVLDERYNMGIAEAEPSILPGAEGLALDALGREQVHDRRVLHYCNSTRHFKRDRTMASDAKLLAFCTAESLDVGETMLKEAFAPYLEAWQAPLQGA